MNYFFGLKLMKKCMQKFNMDLQGLEAHAEKLIIAT